MHHFSLGLSNFAMCFCNLYIYSFFFYFASFFRFSLRNVSTFIFFVSFIERERNLRMLYKKILFNQNTQPIHKTFRYTLIN